MINKICLVIKNSEGDILVNKSPRTTVWAFPFFYKNDIDFKLINSILDVTNEYNIENIKAINYLFETKLKTTGLDSIVTSYYELLAQEKHITKIYNNYFSLIKYVSKKRLEVFYNTSPNISIYLHKT